MRLPSKAFEAHLLAVIVLYVLAFAVYANSLPVPFVFDDFPNIRDNPAVRMTELDLGSLWTAMVESHAQRRPVANVSFALNYFVGGYDVKGYHLVNILIHVVNGVLVYLIALTLLDRDARMRGVEPPSRQRLWLAALLAAALFIVHPVQLQAVTYIVQRMTSLATLFVLLALFLYLLGRKSRPGAARGACWAGALGAWLLALGSKEIAATLPVLVVLTEYLFYRDPARSWPGIPLLAPVLALAATAVVALLYLGADPWGVLAEQYTGREFGPRERLLTELRVVVYYLGLVTLPLPGRLGLEHAFDVSRSLVDPATTLAAAGALGAALLAALWMATRRPIVSFCILWFLISLTVESSFLGLDLAFEHRLYLPMLGPALATGYLATIAPTRHAAVTTACAVTVIAALSTVTVMRNAVWQDPFRLWADTVAKNPASHRARNNLGRALAARGELELAAREFEKAIRIKPDYAEPHNNLGALFARAGRYHEAMVHFAAALAANPRYAQAYNNVGVAQLEQGHAEQAVSMLNTAVRIAPGYAKAHANLARALAATGQMTEACRHHRLARELDPSPPIVFPEIEGCQSVSNHD